jgi:hypothetical protein
MKKEAEAIKPHLTWLPALPDELCVAVFSFCSKEQLYQVRALPTLGVSVLARPDVGRRKVSRVCRDWYRLSSDDAIWRRFVKEFDAEAEVADREESGKLWALLL